MQVKSKIFQFLVHVLDVLFTRRIFNIEKMYDHVHKDELYYRLCYFFNMDVLSKIGFFDENIFLYYEENDFYLRSLKNNFYIYLIEKSVIQHIGNVSTDLLNKDEIEINRNWHLMWSIFYFHKNTMVFFLLI